MTYRLYITTCITLTLSLPMKAATFTVTTNASAGAGSLRAAITSANGAAGADNIVFNIPGIAPHTIAIVTSALPNVTQTLVIDGSTQPANGYTGGAPKIIIDGAALGGGAGLTISAAPSCQLYGLDVKSFPYYGIQVTGDAADNFIIGGTGANRSMVIRNNQYDGIQITAADNGIIQNCYIGSTYGAGACADNLYNGIEIYNGADNNTIRNNNISCNDYRAIDVENADFCTIQGNIIGWVSGSCAGTGYYGIHFQAGSNDGIVGGTGAGQPNIITGSQYDGIQIDGAASIRNRISANIMYCNAPPGGYLGIRLTSGGNASMAIPAITTANATTVSGTSAANAVIEVFQAQNATGLGCPTTNVNQGALYYGTTTASAGGAWSLAGSFSGYVTATARDVSNNTSQFAARVNTGVAYPAITPCSLLVLPSNASMLEAVYENETTTLHWQTFTEKNNQGFEIQRSLDGENWNLLGWLNGSGNTEKTQSYQFNDDQIFTDVIYYRYKQIDYDGNFAYSNVRAVYPNERDQMSIMTVQPNPSSGTFNILINLPFYKKEAVLEVCDITGKVFYRSVVNSIHDLPFQWIGLNGETWETGLYVILLRDEHGVSSEKLIIQK